MSIEQTLNCATDAACANAVRRFAAEVNSATSLRVSLAEAEEDVHVEGEAAQYTLVARWASTTPADGDPAGFDEDACDDPENTAPSAGTDRLLEHYAKALQALARNPLAARAFLERMGQPTG
jgi:hypothetical protein